MHKQWGFLFCSVFLESSSRLLITDEIHLAMRKMYSCFHIYSLYFIGGYAHLSAMARMLVPFAFLPPLPFEGGFHDKAKHI